ncbi:MAG: DUF3016 domain-containing protein [Ramlibacter sp.]
MKSIHRPLRALCLLGGLACAMAAAAGTVNVSFVDPTKFTDAGDSQWDEQANIQAFGKYLQALGWLLPADELLKVEVLDIDLAGTLQPSRRDGAPLRVVRGRADIPRFHLRYTLEAPGQAARSGDEWVSNVNYSQGVRRSRRSEPLYQETHLLQAWFRQRFGPQD